MPRWRYLGPAEAAGRLVQHWHQLSERREVPVVDQAGALARLLAPRDPELAAAAGELREGDPAGGKALLAWRRGREEPRFWALPEEREALGRLIRTRGPGQFARLLGEADQAREHRFRILGLGWVDFGPQVNWQADPQSGRLWPMRHWWQIRYLEADPGDPKYTWELSRLRGAVALARAWWLTGEEGYAQQAVGLALSWLGENRPGWGVNWASSLEVAMRALALLWVYQLCLESRAMTGRAAVRLLLGFAQAGRHLARYPPIYSSPNTHLMGVGLALWAMGVMLPELRPARQWRAVGGRLLEACQRRQVLADGGHVELATGYHCFALEMLAAAAALAQRNGHVPAGWLDTVERMADWARALADAEGRLERLGDGDEESAAFSPDQEPGEARQVLCSAAALLGRPALAPAELASETAWLLGPGAAQILDGLPRAEPPTRGAVLAASGLVVLRDERASAIFDCGPLGGLGGGHAHADALSVTVNVAGKPRLVERGTYSYTGLPPWRAHFRGTSAHNTLTVDGRSQAEPAGPFSWGERGRVALLGYAANPGFELARGSYLRCYQPGRPTTHERLVVLVRGGYLLVCDRVSGSGTHELALHWHLPPGWTPEQPGPATDWPGCERKLVEGGPEPGPGWHSDRYGSRQPAPTLRLAKICSLPQEMVTLIPTGEPASARLAGPGRAVVTGPWGEDRVTCQGAFTLVRRGERGIAGLALAGGDRVCDEQGEPVLVCERVAEHLSVAWGERVLAVEGSGFGRLRVRAALERVAVGGKPAPGRREGEWLVVEEQA